MSNSKVLSVRLPEEVVNTLDSQAKDLGLNRSQFIIHNLVDREVIRTNKSTNQVSVFEESFPLPSAVHDLLATTGGTIAGITSYRFVKDLMERQHDENGNSRYTEGQIEFASFVAALGIAIAGTKLIKDM